MVYFIPRLHRCSKGHEFNYSQSWASEGAWFYPLTATGEPHCPRCFQEFIAHHVPIGVPVPPDDGTLKADDGGSTDG